MDKCFGKEKIQKLIKGLSFPRKWESSLINLLQYLWIPVCTGMTIFARASFIIVLSGIIGFYFTGIPVFAADGPQQQEENKVEIEIEKQAIVVKIERPSIIFPVRWKNPDFPEEREHILKQDFRDEIKKIIEMGNE